VGVGVGGGSSGAVRCALCAERCALCAERCALPAAQPRAAAAVGVGAPVRRSAERSKGEGSSLRLRLLAPHAAGMGFLANPVVR
jgi:hypothetical protein